MIKPEKDAIWHSFLTPVGISVITHELSWTEQSVKIVAGTEKQDLSEMLFKVCRTLLTSSEQEDGNMATPPPKKKTEWRNTDEQKIKSLCMKHLRCWHLMLSCS